MNIEILMEAMLQRLDIYAREQTVRLSRQRRAVIIPKGLRRVAQGCRVATTLGEKRRNTFTPKGLRNGGATLRNPFGVGWLVAGVTQGSRYAALRGNPGLPYTSPSGYLAHCNS